MDRSAATQRRTFVTGERSEIRTECMTHPPNTAVATHHYNTNSIQRQDWRLFVRIHRVPRQRDKRLDGALVRLFPGLFVLRLSSSSDSRLLAQESLPPPAQIGSHPAFTGPRLADRSPGWQTAAGTGPRKGSAYALAGRGQAAGRAGAAHAADCHSPRPGRLHPGIARFRRVLLFWSGRYRTAPARRSTIAPRSAGQNGARCR